MIPIWSKLELQLWLYLGVLLLPPVACVTSVRLHRIPIIRQSWDAFLHDFKIQKRSQMRKKTFLSLQASCESLQSSWIRSNKVQWPTIVLYAGYIVTYRKQISSMLLMAVYHDHVLPTESQAPRQTPRNAEATWSQQHHDPPWNDIGRRCQRYPVRLGTPWSLMI